MASSGKKAARNNRVSAQRRSALPKALGSEAAGSEVAESKGLPSPGKKRTFRERIRSELQPIVLSLFVAWLLIVAKNLWVERTDFGQQLDQAGARILQKQLMRSSGWRGDNIRIVDISSLNPSSPASATNNVVVTDRVKLKEYLDLVASAHPKAIGIDIVFDPVPGGTISDKEKNSEFLEQCLRINNGSPAIPVRVGIYSSLALGPERWLGDPHFEVLGASIVIPFEEGKSRLTGRMFRKVHFNANPHNTFKVESFSYSLFEAVRSKTAGAEGDSGSVRQGIRSEIYQLMHWLVAEPSIESGPIQADSFVIDFGVLRNLMDKDKKHLILAEEIGKYISDLKDKIVLIGRATPGEAPDSFNTTASDEPIPGIFIHAAALDTLMEAQLFKMSPVGSILIDLSLSLFLVFFAILMSFLLDSITHSTLRMNLEVAVPALLAALVISVGWLFVYLTGIYWTDFIVVAFLLLFHKPVEAVFHIAREMVQESLRLLWRKT
jgi:CHASE2 domain-containing sensor protein